MKSEETIPTPTKTVVWNDQLEIARFLKLPKTFAYMGRYDRRIGKEIQPRHLLFIIALACRKYGDNPIVTHWKNIATGLGVRTDTVRRWAYELRNLGLLRIRPQFSSNGKNGPNEFDIAPFVEMLLNADAKWHDWRLEQDRQREAKT